MKTIRNLLIVLAAMIAVGLPAATRRIVPRGDAEGGLGTPTNRWLDVNAVTGSFSAISLGGTCVTNWSGVGYVTATTNGSGILLGTNGQTVHIAVAPDILRITNTAGSDVHIMAGSAGSLGFYSDATELLTILPESEEVMVGGGLFGGDATFSGTVTAQTLSGSIQAGALTSGTNNATVGVGNLFVATNLAVTGVLSGNGSGLTGVPSAATAGLATNAVNATNLFGTISASALTSGTNSASIGVGTLSASQRINAPVYGGNAYVTGWLYPTNASGVPVLFAAGPTVAANPQYSVVIGPGAGGNCTEWTNGTAIGYYTLNGASNINSTTCVGAYAGYNAKEVRYSVGVGHSSMQGASGVYGSTLAGYYAGLSATNISFSIGVGQQALYQSSNVIDVVAIGSNTGRALRDSVDSTLVGHYAGGYGVLPGSTCLGAYAGYQSRNDYGVAIGYNAGRGVTRSNALFISGTSSSLGTNCLIYGEFDNRMLRVNGNLDVTGSVTVAQINATSITVTNGIDQTSISNAPTVSATNLTAQVTALAGLPRHNTNALSGTVVALDAYQLLTITNNVTLTGVSGGVSDKVQGAVVQVRNTSGTSKTLTLPAAWRCAQGTALTVTNNSILSIMVYPTVSTNAAYVALD